MARMPLFSFAGLLFFGCSSSTNDSGLSADGTDGTTDGTDGSSTGTLVLNELVSSASETDDWIELFNGTADAIDLGGFGLTDDRAGDAEPWRFAEGTVVEAGGFLQVWANDGDDPASLETNFKLSGADGETLTLVDPTDATVDEVAFPALDEDTAYARLPDGVGDWAVSTTPTPGATNE